MQTYQQAREQIENGDIVFVHGKKSNIVQRAIMFFTKSQYSHVGIAFWMIPSQTNGHERLMIVEAQGGARRRILNMAYYQGRDLDVYEPRLPWTQTHEQALKRLGKVSYGWLDAFYVGLRESLMTYFKIRLPKKDVSEGEICSEFVAKVNQFQATVVSPEYLSNMLKSEGKQIKIKIRE